MPLIWAHYSRHLRILTKIFLQLVKLSSITKFAPPTRKKALLSATRTIIIEPRKTALQQRARMTRSNRVHQRVPILIVTAEDAVLNVADTIAVRVGASIIAPVVPARGVAVVPGVGTIVEGLIHIVYEIVVIDAIVVGHGEIYPVPVVIA
jgi:hypothetical protein